MKTGRHARILDIIAEHPIETQDELLTRLREEGFKATQATISRDIKDLRLVKTLGSDGKYRYVSASRSSTDIRTNFFKSFQHFGKFNRCSTESCCNKNPQRYGTGSLCRTRFSRLSVCCRNNCRG